MLELKWDASSLQKLIAHRVSKAIREDHSSLNFDDAWAAIISSSKVRYGRGGRQVRTSLRHMLRNTLMRPRDVVVYLRECARVADNLDRTRVDAKAMKAADGEFSRFLRREYVDELQAIIPEIDQIVDYFSYIRKPIFTKNEFKAVFDKYEAENGTCTIDFDTLCQLLFHFSVIGNVPKQTNQEIFRYQNPRARFNEKEKICIHKGLLRAVQVY